MSTDTAFTLYPENTGIVINYIIDSDIDPRSEIIEEWVLHNLRTDETSEKWQNQQLATATIDTTNGYGEFVNGEPASIKEQAVIEKIEQRLFKKLHFPKDWVEEGVIPPNMVAKEKALAICKKLFKRYNLIPDKISPTKEEGVFLCYDNVNYNTDSSLIIEVYNTLETAALVSNNLLKKNDYHEDIKDMNFKNVIQKFKN